MAGDRVVDRALARPISAHVGVALIGHYAKVLRVLAGHQIGKTALAALRVLTAVDHLLRGEDRRFAVVGGNANSRLQCAHRGVGIAAAASACICS